MPRGVPARLEGKRFGLWKVLYQIDGLRGGKTMWVCICECGVTGAISTGVLNAGRSVGCRPCAARARAERRRQNKAPGN
jgi:hypothetical protein